MYRSAPDGLYFAVCIYGSHDQIFFDERQVHGPKALYFFGRWVRLRKKCSSQTPLRMAPPLFQKVKLQADNIEINIYNHNSWA